jgi:hypothetical protein
MPNGISPTSFDERWLRLTRLASLGPVALAIVYSFWSSSPALRHGCSEDRSFASWALWVASPTAFFSFAHLIRKPALARKKGLAWAVVAGAAWGSLGLVAVGLMLADNSFRGAVLPFIASAVEITLAVFAVKTYYSGTREKQDAGVLFKRVGLYFGYFVIAASMMIALPDLWATRRNGRADATVEALHKIKAAQDSYALKYNKGFSASLAALGPPSAGAGPSESAASLIDSDLAHGTASEYVITFMPGARTADGRITAYVLTAQPVEPECRLWKRFLTDQSGTIHVNTGGQPATLADPAI